MIKLELIPVNCGGKQAVKELTNFIKNKSPEIEIKEFKPIPGKFYNCGLSVHIILCDIVSIIAIATSLWSAYEFLKKKKSDDTKIPKLIINSYRTKNNFYFKIDDKIKSKDELIAKLKEEINKI